MGLHRNHALAMHQLMNAYSAWRSGIHTQTRSKIALMPVLQCGAPKTAQSFRFELKVCSTFFPSQCYRQWALVTLLVALCSGCAPGVNGKISTHPVPIPVPTKVNDRESTRFNCICSRASAGLGIVARACDTFTKRNRARAVVSIQGVGGGSGSTSPLRAILRYDGNRIYVDGEDARGSLDFADGLTRVFAVLTTIPCGAAFNIMSPHPVPYDGDMVSVRGESFQGVLLMKRDSTLHAAYVGLPGGRMIRYVFTGWDYR